MTVTQRLMAPGTWRLSLTDETPNSVLDQIMLLDHVVITSTHETDTTLVDGKLATSYAGVITGRPSRRSFAGYGVAWWLGSADGVGPVTEIADGTVWIFAEAESFADQVAAIWGNLTGSGSVDSSLDSAFSDPWTLPNLVTARELLDGVCAIVGAEWRATGNFRLDFGTEGYLFNSTPEVVVTRNSGGVESGVRGIESGVLSISENADGICGKVIVVANGEGLGVGTGSSSGTPTGVRWRMPTVPDGSFLPKVTRIVDAPTVEASDAAALAASTRALFSSPRKEVSVSSVLYNVGRFVEPGDSVWLYDPDAGLVDLANQVEWRGELITPIKMRVSALTWPIEHGLGVYARLTTNPVTYLDLTPYVAWESGPTWWDVGTNVGVGVSGTPGWGPYTPPPPPPPEPVASSPAEMTQGATRLGGTPVGATRGAAVQM